MITRFKFRAECIGDVLQFMDITPKPFWLWKMQQHYIFPDVDFEFTTEMTMTEVLQTLFEIPDSHVMMDTVMPIEKYTGERRYLVLYELLHDDKLHITLESACQLSVILEKI